jgi:glycosyltransferase involved in cell wall biosynthesis
MPTSPCDISAVVPAYNASATILRTLRAIESQTVVPDEIVVVDDGSTDDTTTQVASLCDPRIRVIRQVNQGVSAARNSGIREARSSLVAFCDADDLWSSRFVETILALRSLYPDAVAYATCYRTVPPDAPESIAVANGLCFDGPLGVIDDYFHVASCSAPPIHSSAVAVPRSALDRIGGFPVGIVSGEDLLTWARLAAMGSIAYSREVHTTHFCPARLDFTRRCDPADPVGAALRDIYLAADAKHRSSMRRYLARWHEMRCIIALGQRNPALARRHALLNLRLQGISLRALALGLVTVLPAPIGWTAFTKMRLVRGSKRRVAHAA